MPSFSVPLSGLDASSQALTLIANNLANLNTPGYKSSSSEFTTLFYQNLGTSGDGDPMQEGTGAEVGAVSMNFTDGAVNPTGINSNAAIQGNGLFVTDNNGQQQFTRSGNFTVSSNGFLQTPDGAMVQGYAAVNGVVNPNGPLSSLQVGSGVNSPARATNNVTIGLNLDSNTAVGANFSQPVQVFDSLGGTHTVTIDFTKTGSNAWNYTATLPGADTGSATPTTLASGSISFNAQGQLVPTVAGPPPKEDITLSSAALTNGASALNLTWHLFDGQGNSQITQTASASAPLVTQQDGAASGNLISFSIGSDGTVTGSFSNGLTQSLGQIALATFANPQGIQAIGSNAFLDTTASGLATIGVPGTGSRGKLQGGAIEQSNVDIAAEFSNLIQAQRGYEANAHTVTTFDQITQDTINMKAGL
ncbi:MAG TPA: flagellar hook protein FlgE [Terriglobales bacterium]|nr:flagellar hook protein FlgE [Terriglobales bacterium]